MLTTAECCHADAEDKKVSTNVKNWGSWLRAGCVAVLIAALYSRVVIDLVIFCWRNEQWSQGVLMPWVAAYVAWTRRNQLFACAAKPDKRGLAVVCLACLMFVAGKLSAEVFLPSLSIFVLLAGLAWTAWGLGRLKILILPLLLAVTMVPIPALLYNTVSIPLKLVSASAATMIAQAAGTVVYQDGNVLQLPRMTLGVEDACNGIAALSSLFASALLLGTLFEYERLWPRIAILIIAIPIAIMVNIARIAGTAIIADAHPEFAAGFYHLFSGWLLYALGFAALYLTAKALSRAPNASEKRAA